MQGAERAAPADAELLPDDEAEHSTGIGAGGKGARLRHAASRATRRRRDTSPWSAFHCAAVRGGQTARVPPERVWTRALLVFLAGCAAVVAGAIAVHSWPVTPAAALATLRDNDVEARERRALLQVLVATAAGRDEPAALRLGRAMAAVALEQEAAYRAFAEAAGQRNPVRAGEASAELLASAALGDPVLAALLAAMAAEAAGRADDAATGYRQVAASSRLFHMALAGRLAAEGLHRVAR